MSEFSKERQEDFAAVLQRSMLEQRLRDEGETKLANKLGSCGQELNLTCQGCGHQHPVHTSCKRKWCPVCCRKVAARNKRRMLGTVLKFRWPLHVTLTCRNTATVEGLRRFQKAFTKFRRWKLWTKNVKGGVCGYEMTSDGESFHPHAHLLIDCEWLAIETVQPNWKGHPDGIKYACFLAHDELSKAWAKALGQSRGAVVWVKRVAASIALTETLKYSVKTSDLIEMKGAIGPIIRALDSMRCMTTFGKAYKLGPEEKGEGCECPECHCKGEMMPTDLVERMLEKERKNRKPSACYFG